MKNLSESERHRCITLIEKWRTSGISQGEFCRREGIKRSTFQHWRKRYDPTYVFQDKRVKTTKAIAQSTSKEFLAISIKDNSTDIHQQLQEIEITYPTGVVLKSKGAMSIDYIRALLILS